MNRENADECDGRPSTHSGPEVASASKSEVEIETEKGLRAGQGSLPALLLGVPLGVGLAVLAWFVVPEQFTATEYMRISQNVNPLIFDSSGSSGRMDLDSYRIFQSTHKQLLTQPLALSKALRDPEVANLPVVKENPDLIDWLQQELKVEFPDGGEIIAVSLTCSDPFTAKKIVSTICSTYYGDVVETEMSDRALRAKNLRNALDALEVKIRHMRNELTATVESLGIGDAGTLNIAQQSTLQQLQLLHSEVSRINLELLRAQGELQARTGAPATSDAEQLNRTENIPVKIAIMEKHQSRLLAEIDAVQTAAKNFGRSSIDVEMRRQEIDHLEPMIKRLNQEVERTNIEMNSSPRVAYYRSDITPIGRNKRRFQVAIAGGLFGLLFPLIVFKLRRRRAN